jgi:hypothetical protein
VLVLASNPQDTVPPVLWGDPRFPTPWVQPVATLAEASWRWNKIQINALGREGVCRFTGLALWTGWREKGDYLPLILPLTSGDGFCLCRYRSWRWKYGSDALLFGVLVN